MDERFCDHHADCGAHALAKVLGTTARDVVVHMGELGVEIPLVPLLGDICPMCGRRMPVRGHAAENGVCDACNTRLNLELRQVRDAERRARNEAVMEAMRRYRSPSDGGDG